MAFDYARSQATATRLISKFGRSLTLTKKGSTASDPSKPWEGGTATDATTSTLTGVELGDTSYFKDDDRVEATDRAFIVDGLIEPAEGDKITDSGVVFEIVAAKRIQPGDTALAYMLALRA